MYFIRNLPSRGRLMPLGLSATSNSAWESDSHEVIAYLTSSFTVTDSEPIAACQHSRTPANSDRMGSMVSHRDRPAHGSSRPAQTIVPRIQSDQASNDPNDVKFCRGRPAISSMKVKNYRFAILANEAAIPFFVAQRSRLRNRDLGIAPTEHPPLVGATPSSRFRSH